MSTNFYAFIDKKAACQHCGRGTETEELHIGKRSGGWVFGFHAVPDKGIRSWADWHKFIHDSGATVKDEYGRPLSLGEFSKQVYATLEPSSRRNKDVYTSDRNWLDKEGFDFSDYEFS